MIDAFDVSSYIISLSEKTGESVTNMKLQKLLYYSYVWNLVNFNEKLFLDNIEAWQYGPVVPSVYILYRDKGADNINTSKRGDLEKLSQRSKDLIDEVFNVYGAKSAMDLMNLTHSEAPWRDTYTEDANNVISDDLIVKFYRQMKQAEG